MRREGVCVCGEGGGLSTANNQHHSNISHQYFILNQVIQEIPYTALQLVIHKYISTERFLLKHLKIMRLLTQKIYVEKHVRLHKHVVEKFDLKISVNPEFCANRFSGRGCTSRLLV